MVDHDSLWEENSLIPKLNELLKIYETAKRFIFLSEYYNQNHKIAISIINELRNALDHVMRAIKEKDNFAEEINKAERHLYRSAFDACEVIVINRLNYIYSFKEKYNLHTLNSVYPEYQKEFLPSISSIIEDLANLRAIEISSQRIEKYELVVSRLIQICDVLDAKLSDNDQIIRKTKYQELFSNKYFAILLGFIAFTVSLLSIINFDSSNAVTIIWIISFIIPLGFFFFLILKRWRDRNI